MPSVIDIVPGRSIGDVRLGARVSDLPARATLNRPGGEMDGVRFVVDGEDRVEDVWIDDLRTFPTEIRLGDKVIPRGASLEDVQTILGGCAALAGIKGGLFFNCAAGVSIGTDFSKATLQIRVKPRTVG